MEKIGNIFIILLLVVEILFIAYFAYGILFVTKTSEFELIAMSDSGKVSVSFFLLCGSVDGEPIYKYLYEKDGYIRQDYHYATSSMIIESMDTPKVTFKWNGFFGHRRSCQSIFVIPPGSIVRGFEVDLK